LTPAAVGGFKTYNQFIRDCDNPDLLREVLMIKKNESNFPGVNKIKRISFYAATAAVITAIFQGKKMAKSIQCVVYRYFIPKKVSK